MRLLLQLKHEGVLMALRVRQENAIDFQLRLAVGRGSHRITATGLDARLQVFRPVHHRSPIDLELKAALFWLLPLPPDRLPRRIGDGLCTNTRFGVMGTGL
jgi:hypothetical protein